MSQANPGAVREYLRDRGISPEVIEWKYFDAAFNRGRERGVVWLRDARVAGFLGLIPFEIGSGPNRMNCAWSCDWSVDPAQAGMGLMLVKRARELYDGIYNVGGNDNTRRIFPRLADATIPDAGVRLVLPLRLGSLFAAMPQGRLRHFLNEQHILGQIPIRRAPRRMLGIKLDQGISPALLAALQPVLAVEWRPFYDSEFISWQIGRCPALSCWSFWDSREPSTHPTGLIWTSRWSSRYWRMALCGTFENRERLSPLLKGMISFAYAHGAVALFVIASRLETHFIEALRHEGFLRRAHRLPFYAMRGQNKQLPAEEFVALSYLDADLAYRFEVDDRVIER